MASKKKKALRGPHPDLPPLDSPLLAHITPDLRALAVPVGDLVEDAANLRLHDESSQRELIASYAQFTQRKPVVVQVKDSGKIVRAGNGTLRAHVHGGKKWIAAVLVEEDDLTATRYAIADNRTAELSKWDLPALHTTLESLSCDVPGVGKDFLDEIKHKLDDLSSGGEDGSGGGEDPGASKPPKNPASKPGEIYELGPHRLICGDATDPAVVDRLLAGAKPNLMVTDPPYGVNYDPEWRAETGLVAEGQGRMGKVQNDDRADWRDAWALFPGDIAYVWHAGVHASTVDASLAAEDFVLRAQIIWAKPRFAISRGAYHWQHEPCWYAVRKGKTAKWIGDRSQTTLWEIPLDKNLEGDVKHSTQKPLECMERPIRHHEGSVYDPFCGSGTTLIAAARRARVCYAVELDPAYCDVIRKRWGDYARANGLEPGSGSL